MSNNYTKIKDFFTQRFPEAGEKILHLVANNHLKGLRIKQNLEDLDDDTTAKVITFLSTLTPQDLEDLIYNALKKS